MKQRSKTLTMNGDNTTVATIKSLSDIPEQKLAVKRLKKIKRARSNGKSCETEMRELFEDDDDDVMDEVELNHEEEEEEARLLGGGSFSTESKDDGIYRGVDQPDETVGKDVAEFVEIFDIVCMVALGGCFFEKKKMRKLFDDDIIETLDNWISTNVKKPLTKLISLVSKNEDHNALFTQLMRSASLDMRDVTNRKTKCTCILSGKHYNPENCTEIVLVDDPTFFKPLQPSAATEFSKKPHIFIVKDRFSNLVYSVFHLRTLLYGIAARCVQWATENKKLKDNVPDIIKEFRDHDPKHIDSILKEFRVSKQTIEKYCEKIRQQ